VLTDLLNLVTLAAKINQSLNLYFYFSGSCRNEQGEGRRETERYLRRKIQITNNRLE
jgi:hypothetical protein